jgi:hypothetical protein
MSDVSAKEAFLAFVQSAATMAMEHGRPLQELRGVALYDPARDRHLTDLDAFGLAAAKLVDVSKFSERMGAAAAVRVSLQFAYEYFARVNEVAIDQQIFEHLWADFIGELDQPKWLSRGVANIRNFGGHLAGLAGVGGDALSIPLGDGISIRGRHFEELSRLGFGAHALTQVEADWHDGHGASSFVLVVDQDLPKTPENLITTDTTPWVKAMRAVGAMRLVGDGDVGIGPMWITRPARFNVGIGGTSRVGVSVPSWGHPYEWTEEQETTFPVVYAALARLELIGYQEAPATWRLHCATSWPPMTAGQTGTTRSSSTL